jgi:alkylated DNA repair protein alkB family protein 6
LKDAPHGAPNHVLINEYLPGQGIMPHEDGATYFPLVATVSLGAPIVLDIYDKNKEQTENEMKPSGEESEKEKRRPKFRILQEPRSVLVTSGSMYTDYLHGIAETEADSDLTPKTIANWDLLGGQAMFQSGSYQRHTRTSLTYRDVLKVSKIGKGLKFLPGSR